MLLINALLFVADVTVQMWHASGHLCCAQGQCHDQQQYQERRIANNCVLSYCSLPTSIKQLLLLASPSFSYCGC